MSSGAKFKKKSKRGETQSYSFCFYHRFGNFYSCVLLQLLKWDAYDEENTTGKARRCHPGMLCPTFIPETGLKCLHGKLFRPASGDPGWKIWDLRNHPARPLVWTYRKFYKGFKRKVRSWKLAGPARSTGLMWRSPYKSLEEQFIPYRFKFMILVVPCCH